MDTNLPRGIVFTLEGMDGCGKTTQALRLVENLRGLGREVVHVKEPGGAIDADKIRKLLLTDLSDDAHPGVEVMLFMAAKIDLYQRVIAPALKRGALVVSERGWYSMFAYQGGAGALGHMAMLSMRENSHRFGGPPMGGYASLQILLRQSLDKCRERMVERDRLDHFESKSDGFYREVYAQFEESFHPAHNVRSGEPYNPNRERVETVDVEEGSIELIAAQVFELAQAHIKRTSPLAAMEKPMYIGTNMNVLLGEPAPLRA